MVVLDAAQRCIALNILLWCGAGFVTAVTNIQQQRLSLLVRVQPGMTLTVAGVWRCGRLFPSCDLDGIPAVAFGVRDPAPRVIGLTFLSILRPWRWRLTDDVADVAGC